MQKVAWAVYHDRIKIVYTVVDHCASIARSDSGKMTYKNMEAEGHSPGCVIALICIYGVL